MSGIGGRFGAMSRVLVASAAGSARALVDSGSEGSEALWRFGVLQLLDDYDSVLRRDGWEAPGWARDPDRVARPWWFVSDSACGRAWALAQSPGGFESEACSSPTPAWPGYDSVRARAHASTNCRDWLPPVRSGGNAK